ncbi:hypothetical protein [Mycolicibacterium frederiksbergense]|uniref:hypothetical protein n=1 Tax=Mycolicibacterium frederiksbergense TaxID=117567 RepID=UPI00265BA0F9|nr:hypothetical protein [Mycolicibacterium frederiksbergense]MDO0977307.1 hypothetical protein [Mycolicibacterium frederiksbergense]
MTAGAAASGTAAGASLTATGSFVSSAAGADVTSGVVDEPDPDVADGFLASRGERDSAGVRWSRPVRGRTFGGDACAVPDVLSCADESASPAGAPSAESALGPADESLEPVVSANATGIQVVIAAPMPNATAKAPTRPI